MGWLKNKISLGIYKTRHSKVENTLEGRYGIPLSEIKEVNKVNEDEELYEVLFAGGFVDEKALQKFLDSSSNYFFDQKDRKFQIYTEGQKGRYNILNLDLDRGEFDVTVSFINGDLLSDSKIKLDFLNEYTVFMQNGYFNFNQELRASE